MKGAAMNNLEILDRIQRLNAGDRIRVNDWKRPMKVCAVSDHYVLAYNGQIYTIISKAPQDYSRNHIEAGDPFCATDWWTFGYHDGYNFASKEWCEGYMNSLESGETEMSERHREAIHHLELITENG